MCDGRVFPANRASSGAPNESARSSATRGGLLYLLVPLELECSLDATIAVRQWSMRLEEMCDLFRNGHAVIVPSRKSKSSSLAAISSASHATLWSRAAIALIFIALQILIGSKRRMGKLVQVDIAEVRVILSFPQSDLNLCFVKGLPLRSNHAHRNFPPLTLREFQTRLLRLCFGLERFRQRCELTADVLEEQPLLDNYWHLKFIARLP